MPYMYADDSYIDFKAGMSQSLKSLLVCLNEVKVWLSNHFLQLNERKSEIIIFGPPKVKEKIASSIAPLGITVKDSLKNLGVIID